MKPSAQTPKQIAKPIAKDSDGQAAQQAAADLKRYFERSTSWRGLGHAANVAALLARR